jgi:hypothetical protein
MTVMAAASNEQELRYWLANEDWHMSAYTRNWLARTPPDAAADILADIAEDARAEPRAPLSVLTTVFASSGMATSDAIGGKGPGARRAGARAALMLARMGDIRAIAPLIRIFDLDWLWQSKYQTEVEAALTRLLPNTGPETRRYETEIRQLAERIWDFGRPRRDLSPSLTELLLVILSCLPAADGEPNQTLLQTIAGATVKGANRQRVQEAARALLDA